MNEEERLWVRQDIVTKHKRENVPFMTLFLHPPLKVVFCHNFVNFDVRVLFVILDTRQKYGLSQDSSINFVPLGWLKCLITYRILVFKKINDQF